MSVVPLVPGSAPPAEAHGTTNVTGCQVKATLGGKVTWHHFTRPHAPCEPNPAAPTQDHHIRNEMIRLIDNTPPGEVIRGTFRAISDVAVYNALADAHARGVTVRFTFTFNTASGPMSDPVQYEAIGGRRCGGSPDRQNGGTTPLLASEDRTDGGGRWACISDSNSGISHTKAMTFSKTTDPDGVLQPWVTWTSSHNPSPLGGGYSGYNNAMTAYNDSALYGNPDDYSSPGVYNILWQMWSIADRPNDANGARRGWLDYYQPNGRGFVNGSSANVIASPSQDDGDFVAGRLNFWQPNANCEVRVQQLAFTRMSVADELVQMANGGCEVRVLAAMFNQAIVDKLRSSTGAMYIRQSADAAHDKSLMVKGNLKTGGGVLHQVYAGSHNLIPSNLSENDEFFTMLDAEGASHPVYDAYVAHFAPQGPWSRATGAGCLQTSVVGDGCRIYT